MRAAHGKLFLAENRNGRASMVTVKGYQATVTTLLDGLKQPTAIEPSGDTMWVGTAAPARQSPSRCHADGKSRCSKRTSTDHSKFLGSVCSDGAPVHPRRAVQLSGSSDEPPSFVNIELYQTIVSHFQQKGLARLLGAWSLTTRDEKFGRPLPKMRGLQGMVETVGSELVTHHPVIKPVSTCAGNGIY
jgi:hypothetical protein